MVSAIFPRAQCVSLGRSLHFRRLSSTSERIFVGIGSNLGDRVANIHSALQSISDFAEVVNTSFLYESKPMYIANQPSFLNAVAELKSSLEPFDLLHALKSTEKELGRVTGTPRFGPRLIDLDILLYGERVQDDHRGPHPLQLPHPRIAERNFVVLPLSDISPKANIPGFGTVEDLKNRLPDDGNSIQRVAPMQKGKGVFPWGSRTLLMGIINTTPDSFSDGGQHATVEHAVKRAGQFVETEFDIIDIGGHSTRPGAQKVSAQTEYDRVIPVIKAIHANYPEITLSVDTFRGSIASAAIDAGAHIVNDVSAGEWCENMRHTLATRSTPWVAMHTRVRPLEMSTLGVYTDVVSDAAAELECSMSAGIRQGIARWNIIADGGIGFAKDASMSQILLREWPKFQRKVGGYPTLLGLSRKSFLGKMSNARPADDRDWNTAGAVSAVIASKAVDIVRIHEPKVADAVRAADFIVR